MDGPSETNGRVEMNRHGTLQSVHGVAKRPLESLQIWKQRCQVQETRELSSCVVANVEHVATAEVKYFESY